MAGALQQTAGNHAAISALAVDRNRSSRSIAGNPCGNVSSARHCTSAMCPACHSPSRRTSSTSNRTPVSRAQLLVQFLRRNLRRLQHRQPRLLPRRHAARQIAAQLFDAHTRQPQPGFLNLRIACRQSEPAWREFPECRPPTTQIVPRARCRSSPARVPPRTHRRNEHPAHWHFAATAPAPRPETAPGSGGNSVNAAAPERLISASSRK